MGGIAKTPYTPAQCLGISALCTVFITYPNVMWLPWNITAPAAGSVAQFWATFIFRCLFFFALCYVQIRLNAGLLAARGFLRRFLRNLLITLGAGLLFTAISAAIPLLSIQSATVGKHLTFQFLVVSLLCTFIGYIAQLTDIRRQREREMERLKMESLQSRYDALMHHINPHFFFNSLGGISSLVQNGDEERTLDYISRLSDIFRYTLRTDSRQTATLREEADFAQAFAEVMEVRHGGKLRISITISPEYGEREVPVLTLLPLLENVTVHNRIDSSHPMTIRISAKEDMLTVSNTICPKLTPPESNGTGLRNLDSRCLLTTGRHIEISNDNQTFKVSIPLI